MRAASTYDLLETSSGMSPEDVDQAVGRGAHLVESLLAARRRLPRSADGSGEVCSVVPCARLDADQLNSWHACELAALAAGRQVRALFLHRAVEDPATGRLIQETGAAGAAVRFLSVLPFWLTIVDLSVVMAAWKPDDIGHGALFLRGRSCADWARAMFDRAWVTGKPLTDSPFLPVLTDSERQVLVHLTMGDKDEAGARQLGMSARTYRRHVTRLCERLGASSRFEAGVRAVQMGLIP
jgi:DNA-binding CsgD family transcriptional regulator